MRNIIELLRIYADDITATIFGLIGITVLIVGFAVVAHSGLQSDCHVVGQSLSSYYGHCR
jgi:hypothetical protein